MKAREESANLVAPELYGRRFIQQPASAAARAGAAAGRPRGGFAVDSVGVDGGGLGGRRGRRGRNRAVACQELSPAQWVRLREFWEHPTFVQSRVAALFLAVLGSALLTASAGTVTWSHHVPDNATTARSGLWKTCFRPNGSCATNFHLTHLEGHDWQKAILGLMLFSLLFSSSGSVLAGLGICSDFLPRKMYYLHSAGEMCFVSALTSGVGLSVYPYTVRRLGYKSHHYGTAYWIGWSACVLLLLASLNLMLDNLVREFSRPRSCPPCLRRLMRSSGISRPRSSKQRHMTGVVAAAPAESADV